jgi:teichoic acid transport system ATP-binding protein
MAPSADPILVAEGVKINYRTTLEHRRLLGGRSRSKFRTIEAVRGVSFQLMRGETLGIIGHNGSGKSTLLRGLAGLVPLAGGTALAAARPTLLGVGAALNKELSGRRNLYRGCFALGMSRSAINSRIDELIEFSGLEDFIDMPIDSYSTGMRARLAFTIATIVEPEILLLDEALSGGDREFRVRAKARLDEIRAAAGSVILVSHNTSIISSMCERTLWMRRGKVVGRGPTASVLAEYESAEADKPGLAID